MRVSDSSTPTARPIATRAIETLQRIALIDGKARDGQVGGAMTLCLIFFVAILLHGIVATDGLALWIGAITLAAALRAWISRAWRKRRARDALFPDDEPTLRRWERSYVASALITGLSWASLTIVVPDPARIVLPVTLILTIALILSSTSAVGGRLAMLMFAMPIVVAQEANLLLLAIDGGGVRAWSLALVWIVVVVVLFLVRRNAGSMLRDSLIATIEHERRASEQTALIENAPLGILVVRGTRIVACNSALLTMLGYAVKADLVGRSVRVLFPDDIAWRETRQYVEATTRGPVAPRIVRRLRADGNVIGMMLTLAAVATSGGEPEFIGIYEDIEDRLAAEGNYRHALRMQRLVFESAGEGIAIVHRGVIEQANQALADLLGTSTAQLAGRSLASIFDDPQSWMEIERHFRAGTALKIERRVVRSDGRAVWVNVTGRVVEPADDVRVEHDHRSVWMLADLSVQKQKEAENWHHANHDVMTGLPNRRFLQDRLDQALASARRDGRRVAFVELDLDGFKSVNDEHGHRFGDAVLEEVARRLVTVVRELDTVGRWGGDEFVLVLREIDSADIVEETVKRVIARLSEPIAYKGRDLSVGASIGIALYPDHGEDVEILMLAADLAMYASKGAGGNTWRFASSAAHDSARGKYRTAATTHASDA